MSGKPSETGPRCGPWVSQHDGGGASLSLKRSSFSLIELLLVIGIVLILVAAFLPVLSAARNWAKKTQLNNVKQIEVTSLLDATRNNEFLVSGYEGLSVVPPEVGARLGCIFQRLEGEPTREG